MQDIPKKEPIIIINYLTKSDSDLGKLVKQSSYLYELTQKLRNFIGTPIKKHITVANIKNDTLLLHADSPAWAAKIRYSTPDILSFMQNELHLNSIKTVRVKVVPENTPYTKSKTRQKPVISNKTAKSLLKMADTDEKLRLTLQRLARHSR